MFEDEEAWRFGAGKPLGQRSTDSFGGCASSGQRPVEGTKKNGLDEVKKKKKASKCLLTRGSR